MFYWSLVQEVLIFEAETWCFWEAMFRKLERVHVVFLKQIMGQREVRQRDVTWRCVEAEKVLKKAITKSLGEYIDKRQAPVAEWVALQPILEICNNKTFYERGGKHQDLWWRQSAARKQLSDTLKDILVAARERRWKSDRCGGGGGDREVAESESGVGSNGPHDAGTEKGDSQVGE